MTNKNGKTQLIRLADVFFIGPYMMWAGQRLGHPVLTFLGLATILYNGYWYYVYCTHTQR